MDPALADYLKNAVEPVQQLGRRLNEIGAVVVESALGKQVTFSDTIVTPTEAGEIVDEFGVLPHLAIESRVALSEREAYLAATLITLEDANALLGVELTAGDDIALKGVERSAAELSDLIALMLFTDSAVQGSVKVNEARYDDIRDTIGALVDVAKDSPLARVEYDLVWGNSRARVTHVAPLSLLAALATQLTAEQPPVAAGYAGQADEPTAVGPSSSMGPPAVDIHAARFAQLDEEPPRSRRRQGLDLILDVSLRVSVELGRAVLTVQDVLALGPGSVVELNKLAGEPVDVYINDRLTAKGEVVVVDENFGVRVTEIVAAASRQAATA